LVRFWDTSALVPLLLDQEATNQVRGILSEDSGIVAWWGTPLECASAAVRLRREETLSMAEEEQVLDLLRVLRESWLEILPGDQVLDLSFRLLRVHPLKAADALQLAAALVWAGPSGQGELVTFDERLGMAARLEGFRVLPGP
jgi:predicted nucleic acid-binding protein